MVVILIFVLTISLSQCAFAAEKTTLNAKFTSSQINSASGTVQNYVNKYDKLPSYVTINKTKVTMPQFLQLTTSNLQYIKSGKTSKISLQAVKVPSSSGENIKIGSLSKSEYLSLSSKIKNSITSTKSAPANVKSSIGTVGYKNLVYSYSKVLAFYKSNKRLPNFVTVNPWPNTLGWTTFSGYSYHHQTTEYTCGPSSLKMALSHYNLAVSESWLANQAKSNYYTGTAQSGMIKAVKAVNAKYGTKFSMTTLKFTGWNSINSYLAKGVPVIIRIHSFLDTYGTHYVMVTGLNMQTGKVRLADSSYNGKGTFSVRDKGVKVHEVTMKALQDRIEWMINNGKATKPIMPLIKN